jgi:magnesium transporter
VSVDARVYTADGVTDHDADTAAGLAAARDATGTTWVRVSGDDGAALDRVADAFGIHPLSVEDVRNNVRPKSETFDGHAFLLVKAAELTVGETTFDDEVVERPVGLFVGRDWLVTVAPDPVAAVDRVWDTVAREDPRLLDRGPDFTAYRVTDALVDDYFGLLDAVEGRIESFEESVVDNPDAATLSAINEVRRDLLSIRRLLWPTREALGSFARGDPDQVQATTEKYYRDVYDHVVQLVDLTETYRELAGGARDIYMNALSMSTNEVMKTLTVVATIVLPLTLVVGVFGMNFAGGPYNMPELAWRFGYPAVMVGMAGIAGVMLWHFRRAGWL